MLDRIADLLTFLAATTAADKFETTVGLARKVRGISNRYNSSPSANELIETMQIPLVDRLWENGFLTTEDRYRIVTSIRGVLAEKK